MAIALRCSSLTEATSSSTSIAATKPSSPSALQDGDVMYAMLGAGSDVPTTVPSGWVQVATVFVAAACSCHVYRKVVTSAAGEPSTYTFSGFTASRITAEIVAYSGVDNTTPEAATFATNSAGTGATLAVGGLTGLPANTMLIGGACQDSASGTITVPTSWTERQTSTGTGKRASVAELAFAAGGSTGSVTWTFNSSTLPHTAFLGALNPAAGTTAVGKSLDLRWSVAAAVGKSADLRWTVRAAVGKSLDARWSVRAAAGKNLDARWQVRQAVGDDLDLRWQVLGALTSVGKDIDLRWAVRAVAGKQADLRWAVRQLAGDDLDLQWAVRALAGTPLDLRWSVAALIGAAVDLRWAVRQAVGADVDLRWAVEALARPHELANAARLLRVAAERRTVTAAADSRRLVVPAESRIVTPT